MVALVALLSAGIAGFLRGGRSIPAIIALVVVAVVAIDIVDSSEFTAADAWASALLLAGIAVSWWLGLQLRRRLSTAARAKATTRARP
jgi:hypothetical protein